MAEGSPVTSAWTKCLLRGGERRGNITRMRGVRDKLQCAPARKIGGRVWRQSEGRFDPGTHFALVESGVQVAFKRDNDPQGPRTILLVRAQMIAVRRLSNSASMRANQPVWLPAAPCRCSSASSARERKTRHADPVLPRVHRAQRAARARTLESSPAS